MATIPTREYSKRLGPLSAEQLQAALDRFDLGALVAAQPIHGGLFGQNIFLTSTRGEWVLRGCPHHDLQFPQERFVARLIAERTDLQAPWPYQLETRPEIFGWAFALMPRLEGVAEAPDDGDESARSYAHALGEGLARLHELRWEAPGSYDLASDTIAPYPVSQRQRVTGTVREYVTTCREELEALTEDDVEWIESILAANEPALDEPFETCFVHHDWKPSNVLAQHREGSWRITGVVDLMEGYFADGEEDLVRSIGDLARRDRGHARHFASAYQSRRPLRAGYADRYRIYQLLDCLVMWKYGRRNRVWFSEDQRFTAFARYFVEEIRLS